MFHQWYEKLFAFGFNANSKAIVNLTSIILPFLYHIVIFILLKNGIYKPFFKFISVTMNTLVITHILVGYGIFASWIHALRTIVICGYFITIALSGFYLKPFIPIYASILASSVYACMFFYAALFVKVEIGAYETFYELNVSYNHIATMVPAYIMFGLIISYLTKRFKSILYQSVVSEVKAREEEVKNKNIEEMTRQKTDLFINIAHELKTPVTLISNYLEKYIKTTALSKDLHIIRKNVDKLRVDVGNFLDLEKLEQGQIFYNHDKIIDLSNIINEKVVLFKQAALQKNICMSKKNEAGIIIKADPVAIDRILNNLIDNAIRYTDAGGAIHIKLLPGKRSVFIIIRDNGIGISMEQQKHIFSPYFQASRSKANYQGIGMGLYITKKIIDSLKGKITLESEIAKGSVFTVQLKRYVLKEDEKIEREVPVSGFKFHYNDFDLSDKQVIIGRKNILKR